MTTAPQASSSRLHRRLWGEALAIRSLLIGSGVTSALLVPVIIGQMYALSRIIDGVFLGGLDRQGVASWMGLLLGLVGARAALLWAGEVLAQRGAARIKADVRDRVFRQVLRLGPAWGSGEQLGEVVSTAVEGIEKLDDYFARFLTSAVALGVVPVSIAIFVWSLDWLSGLLLLVTGPLIPIFMILIGLRAERHVQRQWESLGGLGGHFLDVLQGIKTLKVYGRSRSQGRRIREVSDRYRRSTMEVLKVAFLSGFVLELAASLSTALVAVEVGVRLIQGTLSFESGLFVLLLAPEFYLPFRTFGARHHAGMEGVAAAGRLYAILDAKPVHEGAGRMAGQAGAMPAIRIEGLRYRYPGSEAVALDDVTMVIESGRMTALAGPSGAGKSTLVNVLLRFLDYEGGDVRIGRHSLRELERGAWLRHVALVPQDPHLFNGTVLKNLEMACPGASFEEVREAVRNAGAEAFIEGLPEGYDTELENNGSRLSGGERQRLAIARAFLKSAPFLILDEPVSALDPESEAAINRAVERLLVNRTVLVIAHRLSTLRRADRTCLLDRGRVVAEGRHEDLLRGSALYAAMVAGGRLG
jgi:ATP-binding cassette, subfamily C, bacterial CydD